MSFEYKKEAAPCISCSNENQNRINTQRFIDKLDEYFSKDDLTGARSHLKYWENEAQSLNDDRGLLAIANEELGLSRKLNDEELFLNAKKLCLKLLEKLDLHNEAFLAIIFTNLATSLCAFDKTEESLEYYTKAQAIYENNKLINTYEYAALKNNLASALLKLKRYDDAIKNTKEAIYILAKNEEHNAEIAISFVNLADIFFEKDQDDFENIEKSLNLAEAYLDSLKGNTTTNYAFVLSKCAPAFRFYKREKKAIEYETISKEIYKKND